MEQIKTYKELRERLVACAENEYQKFSAKLTPSKRPIMGVRIPMVRKIARMVPSNEIGKFLRVEPKTFEEVLIRGFLICRLPYEEMILYFDSQVDYIEDWAACDVFCSGLKKTIKRHREEFLELKVKELLDDSREFAVRVGLVLLKCYYVETEQLEFIFSWTEELAMREEYYIRMAIAWLISECFIRFPAATTGYLISSNLPKWTFNRTISKICDSCRVDSETKKMLKRMRK